MECVDAGSCSNSIFAHVCFPWAWGLLLMMKLGTCVVEIFQAFVPVIKSRPLTKYTDSSTTPVGFGVAEAWDMCGGDFPGLRARDQIPPHLPGRSSTACVHDSIKTCLSRVVHAHHLLFRKKKKRRRCARTIDPMRSPGGAKTSPIFRVARVKARIWWIHAIQKSASKRAEARSRSATG